MESQVGLNFRTVQEQDMEGGGVFSGLNKVAMKCFG